MQFRLFNHAACQVTAMQNALATAVQRITDRVSCHRYVVTKQEGTK